MIELGPFLRAALALVANTALLLERALAPATRIRRAARV